MIPHLPAYIELFPDTYQDLPSPARTDGRVLVQAVKDLPVQVLLLDTNPLVFSALRSITLAISKHDPFLARLRQSTVTQSSAQGSTAPPAPFGPPLPPDAYENTIADHVVRELERLVEPLLKFRSDIRIILVPDGRLRPLPKWWECVARDLEAARATWGRWERASENEEERVWKGGQADKRIELLRATFAPLAGNADLEPVPPTVLGLRAPLPQELYAAAKRNSSFLLHQAIFVDPLIDADGALAQLDPQLARPFDPSFSGLPPDRPLHLFELNAMLSGRRSEELGVVSIDNDVVINSPASAVRFAFIFRSPKTGSTLRVVDKEKLAEAASLASFGPSLAHLGLVLGHEYLLGGIRGLGPVNLRNAAQLFSPFLNLEWGNPAIPPSAGDAEAWREWTEYFATLGFVMSFTLEDYREASAALRGLDVPLFERSSTKAVAWNVVAQERSEKAGAGQEIKPVFHNFRLSPELQAHFASQMDESTSSHPFRPHDRSLRPKPSHLSPLPPDPPSHKTKPCRNLVSTRLMPHVPSVVDFYTNLQPVPTDEKAPKAKILSRKRGFGTVVPESADAGRSAAKRQQLRLSRTTGDAGAVDAPGEKAAEKGAAGKGPGEGAVASAGVATEEDAEEESRGKGKAEAEVKVPELWRHLKLTTIETDFASSCQSPAVYETLSAIRLPMHFIFPRLLNILIPNLIASSIDSNASSSLARNLLSGPDAIRDSVWCSINYMAEKTSARGVNESMEQLLYHLVGPAAPEARIAAAASRVGRLTPATRTRIQQSLLGVAACETLDGIKLALRLPDTLYAFFSTPTARAALEETVVDFSASLDKADKDRTLISLRDLFSRFLSSPSEAVDACAQIFETHASWIMQIPRNATSSSNARHTAFELLDKFTELVRIVKQDATVREPFLVLDASLTDEEKEELSKILARHLACAPLCVTDDDAETQRTRLADAFVNKVSKILGRVPNMRDSSLSVADAARSSFLFLARLLAFLMSAAVTSSAALDYDEAHEPAHQQGHQSAWADERHKTVGRQLPSGHPRAVRQVQTGWSLQERLTAAEVALVRAEIPRSWDRKERQGSASEEGEEEGDDSTATGTGEFEDAQANETLGALAHSLSGKARTILPPSSARIILCQLRRATSLAQQHTAPTTRPTPSSTQTAPPQVLSEYLATAYSAKTSIVYAPRSFSVLGPHLACLILQLGLWSTSTRTADGLALSDIFSATAAAHARLAALTRLAPEAARVRLSARAEEFDSSSSAIFRHDIVDTMRKVAEELRGVLAACSTSSSTPKLSQLQELAIQNRFQVVATFFKTSKLYAPHGLVRLGNKRLQVLYLDFGSPSRKLLDYIFGSAPRPHTMTVGSLFNRLVADPNATKLFHLLRSLQPPSDGSSPFTGSRAGFVDEDGLLVPEVAQKHLNLYPLHRPSRPRIAALPLPHLSPTAKTTLATLRHFCGFREDGTGSIEAGTTIIGIDVGSTYSAVGYSEVVGQEGSARAVLVKNGHVRAFQQKASRNQVKVQLGGKKTGRFYRRRGRLSQAGRFRVRQKYASVTAQLGRQLFDALVPQPAKSARPRPPAAASSSSTSSSAAPPLLPDPIKTPPKRRSKVLVFVGAGGTAADNVRGKHAIDAGHAIVGNMLRHGQARPDVEALATTVDEAFTSSICPKPTCRKAKLQWLAYFRHVTTTGKPSSRPFYRVLICPVCSARYHRDVVGASNIVQVGVVLLKHGMNLHGADFTTTFGFPAVPARKVDIEKGKESTSHRGDVQEGEWEDIASE
ncbi:hypothetical protein NBRC10512_004009 [Rhodotorula toruloides]|uniref:RHTO0S03e09164g1_1 n=2 Tax=Rhodotorula toruloides TaxID=5286 RepID=A0A061AUL9_RHOTO|nr:uncharacterized protein RHTO_00439 [Rhodotorula toruloides NP11]EMS26011.1 hypothetical protein RHTO_00439 [Rhodotorula toruloides NP11]CDR38408.1 RHTO0S03e09164g1_1 [Rhodotorula toruloides]